jgi:ribosomal-protein-alanine N-acetyltransferase
VSNIQARKLYEGRGFSVVGLRRNYYSDNGEDALTMRRERGS